MLRKSFLILFIILTYFSATYSQTKKIQANKNESTITYQITHPLHEIEATSKNVNCWVDLDEAKKEISHVFVQVDVTTFNSGNSNRDSHAMEVIDAISYPYVKFNSSSVTTSANSIKVTGKLFFHGITKDLTFEAVPKWEGNKLTVTGKFQISLTEYKVDRPSLLLVPVNDELKFSFIQVFNL